MSLALTSRRAALLPGRWVSNELWRRARAVPSLDLRFAENKSLVDSVSGQNLITFTRASTGTYVDSDGVIRSAATNLLLRSEEFDNDTVWTKTGSSGTANAITAPTGNLTADKLVEDISTGTHFTRQNVSTAAAVRTASIYLKAGERSLVRIEHIGNTGNAGRRITINLATGSITGELTIGTAGLTSAEQSIVSVGNGWYRLVSTIEPIATTGNTASLLVFLLDAGGNVSYTGDGTSGIYIWGAQLEVGSTATPYIPTGATINSAPRFDHNPLTGECLGLLVEEQRQNLLLQSEDFLTSWSSGNSVKTANTSIAPDGAQTADTITENTNTTFRRQDQGLSASGTVTISVFAKLGTGSRFLVIGVSGSNAANNGTATFDLTTGVVTQARALGTYSNASASVSIASQGFFRCSLTVTTDGLTTASIGYTDTGTQSTANRGFGDNYLGDGQSSLILWGAQLEAGAFPTSYIKTEAAAATRTADIASITGSRFSSWYSHNAGTMFANGSSSNLTASTYPTFAEISDGSSNNRLQYGFMTSVFGGYLVRTGGTGVVEIYPSVTALTRRAAFASALNDFAVSYNGSNPTVDTNGAMPTSCNRLEIGNLLGAGATNAFSGQIRRLTYWPQRLPNSTLQSITL